MPSNHTIKSDVKGQMANVLKQIQTSSKVIDNVLQKYKIKDLRAANYRYTQLKKKQVKQTVMKNLKV